MQTKLRVFGSTNHKNLCSSLCFCTVTKFPEYLFLNKKNFIWIREHRTSPVSRVTAQMHCLSSIPAMKNEINIVMKRVNWDENTKSIESFSFARTSSFFICLSTLDAIIMFMTLYFKYHIILKISITISNMMPPNEDPLLMRVSEVESKREEMIIWMGSSLFNLSLKVQKPVHARAFPIKRSE